MVAACLPGATGKKEPPGQQASQFRPERHRDHATLRIKGSIPTAQLDPDRKNGPMVKGGKQSWQLFSSLNRGVQQAEAAELHGPNIGRLREEQMSSAGQIQ